MINHSESDRRPRHRPVLAIDVGGTHVKVKRSGQLGERKFASGPDLTAKAMVAQALELTTDWDYDAISIGYPGPVTHNHGYNGGANAGTFQFGLGG